MKLWIECERGRWKNKLKWIRYQQQPNSMSWKRFCAAFTSDERYFCDITRRRSEAKITKYEICFVLSNFLFVSLCYQRIELKIETYPISSQFCSITNSSFVIVSHRVLNSFEYTLLVVNGRSACGSSSSTSLVIFAYMSETHFDTSAVSSFFSSELGWFEWKRDGWMKIKWIWRNKKKSADYISHRHQRNENKSINFTSKIDSHTITSWPTRQVNFERWWWRSRCKLVKATNNY